MELSMVIIFFFTWTPTYIYTDKIPPVLLKPFRTTKDIRYSQFIIPKETLIERLSFSLVLDRLCLPDNFTAVFRPHALPLVAPFGLKIPSSAVLHSDFFNVEVNLRDDPTVEITSAFPLSYIQAWVSRNGYFASLEVKISSPCSGLWFMGSLFTDSSFNKDCKLLVFAQNSHEIALDSQNTIVFHKSSGSTLTTNNLPARSGNAIFSTVETKGFSSTPKFSDSRSSWLSGYRSLRSPNTRVTNKQGWTGIESHRRVYRDRVSDDSSYAEKSKLNSTLPCAHSVQFSATNSMAMRRIMRSDPSASAKLVVHLHPSEGRLFQLIILPGMTSADFALESCQRIPIPRFETANISDAPSSARLRHSRQSSNLGQSNASRGTIPCELGFENAVGYLPLGMAVHTLNRNSTVQDSSGLNSHHYLGHANSSVPSGPPPYQTSTPSSSTLLSWKVGRRYRFEGFQTSDIAHYLYLQNPYEDASLEVTVSFVPSFDCTPDEEVTGTDRDEHYSAIPEPVQQLDAKNNSESNATANNSVHWNVSLLPWLNSSWPELTPESGRRRPMRRNTADYPLLNETNLAVDPRNPAHQLLQRCTLWSAPSRVSMPQAFASHFTYQPNSGRYTSGFQLQAWYVVVIPIQLDSRMDSGGTLEISLQLNAFAVTRLLNQTHSQPLLRQVILHGCFARHITSTPFAFIDSTRCPLWLRLATDRGLAVSVAHAVSIAASNMLSRSQPPHRSEVPPALDTSFDDVVDRSFFYLPYPKPGQWYLSLYAECYPVDDPLCSQAAAASIDVGLVMRLTPCLNYRCRDVGEGASLPPSRVLNASRVGIRPLIERPQPITQGERWRPPWLIRGFNASNPRQSPLLLPPPSDMPDDRPLVGEGLCVELLQRSIFASTCACPPGRAGLGCMRFLPNAFSQSNRSNFLGAQDDALDYMWSGHSSNALLLALSNLAFLPAVGLALLRRLWIPALAYSYTLVFSALYHICDTDVMNIPIRIGASTIGGSAMSFGGYALPKSRGYDLLGSEPSGYRPIPTGFRFTSPSCPLPLDVLSFCDFFGGVLSVWVTVVAATACPLRYAQLAYVMFVLSLTVAVQVARYSTGLFLIPCLIGLIVLICSWTYRSKRTGRLFPPIQWWLISFFPGLLLAGIGLILFLSPWMRRDYAKVHSLWHIVIGLSLLGLLPWPRRWRIALVKVVPLQTPLSCGGDHFGSRRPNRTRRVGSARSCRSTSPSSESLTGPGPEVPVTTATRNSTRFPTLRRATQYIHTHSCQMGCRAHQILTVWCDRLDVWLELDRLLDPVVARWPRLDWLLPNGYIPGRSRASSSRSNSMLPTSMPNGPSTHSTDAVSEIRAALQAKQI